MAQSTLDILHSPLPVCLPPLRSIYQPNTLSLYCSLSLSSIHLPTAALSFFLLCLVFFFISSSPLPLMPLSRSISTFCLHLHHPSPPFYQSSPQSSPSLSIALFLPLYPIFSRSGCSSSIHPPRSPCLFCDSLSLLTRSLFYLDLPPISPPSFSPLCPLPILSLLSARSILSPLFFSLF